MNARNLVTMDSSFSVKTCVIGSQGVGKTSLIYQLSQRQFKLNAPPTIGAAFSCKLIDVDSYTVRFKIWDTAGQERYKSMLPMYYRKANLALAVYDITCHQSLVDLSKCIEELKKNAEEDCIICIVGNKLDLEQNRRVDRDKATQFAKSIGGLHFETSAKTSEGVMDAFMYISRQIINSNKLRRSSSTSSTGSHRASLNVVDKTKAEKSSCC